MKNIAPIASDNFSGPQARHGYFLSETQVLPGLGRACSFALGLDSALSSPVGILSFRGFPCRLKIINSQFHVLRANCNYAGNTDLLATADPLPLAPSGALFLAVLNLAPVNPLLLSSWDIGRGLCPMPEGC